MGGTARNRIISTDNLKKIILRQIALIDRDSMVDDLKNWPLWGNNTVRVDIPYDGRWTVSYVINWFKGRVAWMDQEWGYPQEKDQLR